MASYEELMKPKKITVGGATMRREDYEAMLRRNAERRARKRFVDDTARLRHENDYREAQPPKPKTAAPKVDPLDVDPMGNPIGGAADTKPGAWRERVVRIDPFTRPRGPVTHHAVQDVVSQMGGTGSPNITTTSSGDQIRARRAVGREKALAGAYKEAGMPVGGIGAMAREEAAESDMERRRAMVGEERAYRRQEQDKLKQDYLENIESAIDLIQTTELPENASAWAIKNDAVKVQRQLDDLQRFAEHGGNMEKIRPKAAELKGKLATYAAQLETMLEDEQAQEQAQEREAEFKGYMEEYDQMQQQAEAQKAQIEMARQKAEQEQKIAQYKVRADIAKMEIDAAREIYKTALDAETELAKELSKLKSEQRQAKEEHSSDPGNKGKPFYDTWAARIGEIEGEKGLLAPRQKDREQAKKELDEALNDLKGIMMESVGLGNVAPEVSPEEKVKNKAAAESAFGID